MNGTEDNRCPPTYRREEAVKTLIALGWAWDGKDWIAPTPAEQGGRVDFSEADGAALRSLKVGEVLTEGQWESACRFVRHQDDIIRNLRAALAQNAQGDVVAGPISRDDIREMVIRLRNEDSTDDLCVEAADMLATILHTKQDALVEELESLLKTPVGAPTSANGLKWCDICCKEVPERWKLVPCEPTVEMLDAGFIAYEGAEFRKGRASWQAMLAAAPSRAEDAVRFPFGARSLTSHD